MGHNIISLKPETYQNQGNPVEDDSVDQLEAEPLVFSQKPKHMSDFVILGLENRNYTPSKISQQREDLENAVERIHFNDSYRNPNKRHSTTPKDLERIAARGVQVYDWLGRQGEDTGLFIDEIHTVTEPGLGNYDDVINAIDSAFLINFHGKTVPIGLDFTINSGKGVHSQQKLVDDPLDKLTATCNNKKLSLPFGCSTISYGYLESEDGTTFTPSVHSIVPHYVIGLSGPLVDRATAIIDSSPDNPPRQNGIMQDIQFMTLSLIREQNRIYRKILDYPEASDSEKTALEYIETIDDCVFSGLESLFFPPNSPHYEKYRALPEENRRAIIEHNYQKTKRDFFKAYYEDSYGRLMDRTKKILYSLTQPVNSEIISNDLRGNHPRNQCAPLFIRGV